MTLAVKLQSMINASHEQAWLGFDYVRRNGRLYGLPKSKTDKWKSPGEPGFVSTLLEYAFTSGHLSQLIKEHLRPIGLCDTEPVVSGVFIHQKPKVKFFGYRGHVELGDLLLVRQHFRSGIAKPEGRAFLLQAKSSRVPWTGSLTGKEAQQFELYANWPAFEFPHGELGAPNDGSGRWNFKLGPASHQDSGVYGIVANTRGVPPEFPSQSAWAVGAANSASSSRTRSVIASRESLAKRLEGLLLGSSGRPWDATPSTRDHWSSFVVKCLCVAASWRPYPIQRLGISALPRQRDVIGLMNALATVSGAGVSKTLCAKSMADAWLESRGRSQGDNDKPPDEREDAPEPPRAGVSVLYVATFGDGQLAGPEMPPSFDTDVPDHPDAGTW